MKNSVSSRTHARVEAFVAELHELFNEFAIESLQANFAGKDKPAKRAAAPKPAKAAKKGAKRAPKAASARGAKRSPEQLEALCEQIVAAVKGMPECTVANICTALDMEKGDLVLPIRKLLAEKRLTKKGAKRGTKYTVR